MDRDSTVHELVATLGKKKEPFLESVQTSVMSYISSRSFKDCLTIIEKRSYGDCKWKPEASFDYAKCLAAFCSNNTFNGHALDSALSRPVVDLVSKQFEVFYEKNGQEVAEALGRLLLNDRIFMSSLVESIIDSTNKEIPTAIKGKVAGLLMHKIGDSLDLNLAAAAGHAVSVATTKAVGVAVSLPIAHTTVALITKFLALHLKVVLAKVLASSAVKTMIAAAAKKVVVAAIIAALVKIVGAKLTISAGAAFAFVIVPLVAGFIAWEAVHLPEKLGKTVSGKVAAELKGSFDEVNTSILLEVLSQIATTGVGALAAQIATEPELCEALAQLVDEVSRC